jgi:hypothetical protein
MIMKTLHTMFVALPFVAVGFASPIAAAQTSWDAAWKANGMRGMRDSATNAPRGARYSQRSYRPSETRQAFSYEPLDFRVGDRVVIAKDNTVLKVEHTVLATLNKGQEFMVTHIQGPWVATSLEVNGNKLVGWVWFESVKALKPGHEGRAMR